MTKRVEYSILAAFIGLVYAVAIVTLPDAPITQQGLLTALLYVLAKLGVEVIGKPLLMRLFPNRFRRLHTPPE